MQILNYTIQTSMGSITPWGGDLPFLTEEQKKEFDSIGYSGKNLAGERISREDFLNNSRPGERFSVEQVKFDNGDFTEKFRITRVILKQ